MDVFFLFNLCVTSKSELYVSRFHAVKPEKNFEFLFRILKSSERIRVSGSVPTCQGSGTLL